jgi:hypothetical protein
MSSLTSGGMAAFGGGPMITSKGTSRMTTNVRYKVV